MKSLSRWLISITDMPLPRQSSSSDWICCRTLTGSVAGPALKLNFLFMSVCCEAKLKLFRGRFAAFRRRLARLGAGAVFQHDAVEADQAVALARTHHAHALGVAAEDLDLLGGDADQAAAVGDQHDVVAVVHLHRADQFAGLVRQGLSDHALAAAAAQREAVDRRALAVALAGHGEHIALAGDDQGND